MRVFLHIISKRHILGYTVDRHVSAKTVIPEPKRSFQSQNGHFKANKKSFQSEKNECFFAKIVISEPEQSFRAQTVIPEPEYFIQSQNGHFRAKTVIPEPKRSFQSQKKVIPERKKQAFQSQNSHLRTRTVIPEPKTSHFRTRTAIPEPK
jgi:hypothetical protein